MTPVAVLGLGRMGRSIATRLLATGYDVRVWNRHRPKAESIVAAGATWAETPAQAATGAAAIYAMVTDDDASAAVWSAADGALTTASAGSLAIECSTLSARHVEQLAAQAQARGLRYIDCPVTGLPDAAAAGTLALLVGADTADLEHARPFLAAISNTIRHFGAVGAGTAYKLMINLMGTVQIAALAEGLALAERLGLERETVIDAVEHSAAASPQVVRYVRLMAEHARRADPSFTTALRHKDAAYGVEMAATVGAAVPLGEAATAWFATATAIDPNADEAIVIDAMRGGRRARPRQNT